MFAHVAHINAILFRHQVQIHSLYVHQFYSALGNDSQSGQNRVILWLEADLCTAVYLSLQKLSYMSSVAETSNSFCATCSHQRTHHSCRVGTWNSIFYLSCLLGMLPTSAWFCQIADHTETSSQRDVAPVLSCSSRTGLSPSKSL